MLKNFTKSTSEAEKDTMKVVYDELDKLRPTLIELANETEDYDDAIGIRSVKFEINILWKMLFFKKIKMI